MNVINVFFKNKSVGISFMKFIGLTEHIIIYQPIIILDIKNGSK